VFQEFKLVNGTWDVKNVDGELERVRPEDIKTTAHFTVEGELDDISGSGQTEAAHSLCYNIPKGLQKHLEVKGAGHYGIFSGRRWRDIVYPQVKAFILENNQGLRPAKRAAAAKPAAKSAPSPQQSQRQKSRAQQASLKARRQRQALGPGLVGQ
jgi:poly(3-hydroxybutyrate) depolymerase